MTRALRFMALALVAAACAASGPVPIVFDSDACAQCRMQISDTRFGAELVTKRGRVVKFDAIECFREYEKQAASANDVASRWVIDFSHPGTFIPATEAWYVAVPGGKSPMGKGLLATRDRAEAESLQRQLGGVIRRWQELE